MVAFEVNATRVSSGDLGAQVSIWHSAHNAYLDLTSHRLRLNFTAAIQLWSLQPEVPTQTRIHRPWFSLSLSARYKHLRVLASKAVALTRLPHFS